MLSTAMSCKPSKTIWQTEHHFWYDGYSPALLTVAGGIAAATKHIQIGQSTMLFSQHEALGGSYTGSRRRPDFTVAGFN